MWKNNKGFSVFELAFAAAIAAASLYFYFISTRTTQVVSTNARERIMAQTYAVELVEFFLMHSVADLTTYITDNAIDLCVPINQYDRASTSYVGGRTDVRANIDPSASLNWVNVATMPELQANRWYEISVVDRATLTVTSEKCFGQPDDGVPPVSGVESYLVEVWVNWVVRSSGRTLSTATQKNIYLKSILAQDT